MAVRAKFRVKSKLETEYGTVVKMHAVYSSDPSHENKQFAEASPHGSFEMMIKREGPHGHFVVGEEYYLDFIKAARSPA